MSKRLVWQRHIAKYGEFCYYCGTPLTANTMTVEHIIPRVRGGNNSPENTAACCLSCNTSKRDKTVEQFRTHCRWKKMKYSEIIGWPQAKRLIDAGVDFGEIPECVFHFEK